jgi:ComF family protein
MECTDKLSYYNPKEYLPVKNFYPSDSVEGVFCLFVYEGMIRESIIKYKFFENEFCYRTFGNLLAKKIEKFHMEYPFDAIVSIPLHKNRLKERGFNQSYLISSEISKILKIKEISSSVIRAKDTKKQSTLPLFERKENVKDSFIIARNNETTIKRLLIIDDILTTGSTIEELANTFKEYYEVEVFAGVIASGRKLF